MGALEGPHALEVTPFFLPSPRMVRRARAVVASPTVRGGGIVGAAWGRGEAHHGGRGVGRLGNEDVARMATVVGRACKVATWWGEY